MDRSPPHLSGRTRTLLSRLLVVVLVVPMFVAAGTLAARGWNPTSDLAQAELRMRSFWANPPEIGAAGRIGDPNRQGAHPGPAAWWAMYPSYAVGGRSPGALSVSVALLAATSVVGGLAVTARVGGRRAMLCVAAGLALVIRALGPAPFVEPWNPYLGIFPFVVFLASVWAVAAGHRWFLVSAALAGSFVVQQHVGYIPLVVALGGAAAAWVALGLRAAPRRPAATVLGVALAVTAAMWALPIHQQLRDEDGNLAIVWNSFRTPGGEVIGVGSALRVIGGIFGAVGTWAVRSDVRPLDRSPWWSAAAMLLAWSAAAVAATLAWRRRAEQGPWRSVAALHAVLGLGLVVGVVAASRIFGEVFDYLLEWMRILAAFAAAATVWTAWELARSRRAAPSRDRLDMAVGSVLAVVLVGVSSWSALSFRDVETPGRRLSDQMAALAEVADDLDPDLTYVVRWADPVALGALGFGAVLELERAGLDVGADPPFATAVLPARILEEGQADRSLWVVTGDRIDALRAMPGVTELAYVDVRTDAERSRVEELRTEVRRRLAEVGGDELASMLDLGYWNVILAPGYPEDLAPEIAELGDLGLPSAVFSAPADLASLPAP